MQSLYQQFLASSRMGKALMLLFFIAPAMTAAVRGGGSAVYTLALLPALFLAWPAWKELGHPEKNLIWSLVALFLVSAASLFFSEQPYEGGKELERFFRLMSLALILMLLVRCRVEVGRVFLTGSIVTGVILVGYAGYEVHYLGQQVAKGPYYQIALSLFGVLTASIAGAAVLTLADTPVKRSGYFIVSMLGLYASYLSGGRGSWVAIPVVLLLFGWLMRHRIGVKSIVASVLIIALSVVALLTLKPDTLTTRVEMAVNEVELFQSDPSRKTSVGNRLNMWRNSLIIWSRNPVIGSGLGDFKHDNNALVDEGVAYNPKMRYTEPHSIYFDALAATGILGFVATLLALVILPFLYFYRYWEQRRQPVERFYSMAGMATITIFAVAGLTESWFGRNIFVVGYVMTVVAFLSSLFIHERWSAHGR